MSNEVSSLLDTECLDDELGTFLQFESPSDAIFARMFLKAESVSWTSFDTILSTLRNPSFDVMQVTFKDAADFFAQIAQIRGCSLLRHRKDDMQLGGPGLPEIVLDGLFDVLDGELQHSLHRIREESYGFTPCHFSIFREIFDSWRTTLFNCSFVHSSWLARARRALGRCRFSTLGNLYHSAKSPWIGGWTFEMHLLLYGHHFSPNIRLLPLVFARLPNLRHLEITTHIVDIHRPDMDSCLTTIIDALALLPNLEDLILSVTDILPTLIQKLSARILPNLKVLHLVDSEASIHDLDSLEIPHQYLPLLSKFPLLHTIRFDIPPSTSVSGSITGITWTKDSGSSALSNKAVLSSACVLLSMSNIMDARVAWNRWQTSLAFVRRIYCDSWCPPAEVKSMLALCSSLHTLSINLDLDFSGTLDVIPPSVKVLDYNFTQLSDDNFVRSFDDHPSPLETWDSNFASALLSAEVPNLRVLRVHFASETAELCPKNTYMDADRRIYRIGGSVEEEGTRTPNSGLDRRPILAACRKSCRDRGIHFSEDVRLGEGP